MEQNLIKCFAIDSSGSTRGERFYHDNVKKILDQKYNMVMLLLSGIMKPYLFLIINIWK